jgi:ribonuclease P protein component
MTGKFTLGKEERLKNNLSIQQLLKDGKVISNFPLKLFWNFSPDPHQYFPVRAAMIVPKRKFKRAVDRNLMKRRLREAYRLNKPVLYETLDQQQRKIRMVVLLLSDEFISYAGMEKGMREIIRLLANKITKTPLS